MPITQIIETLTYLGAFVILVLTSIIVWFRIGDEKQDRWERYHIPTDTNWCISNKLKARIDKERKGV